MPKNQDLQLTAKDDHFHAQLAQKNAIYQRLSSNINSNKQGPPESKDVSDFQANCRQQQSPFPLTQASLPAAIHQQDIY